jgi:hypothetical protein
MVRSVSWWRQLGTALFVLVLTMFAVGPVLDTLLCRTELGTGAVAAEYPTNAREQVSGADEVTFSASQVGDPNANHGADGLACVHGHCHHGGQYVPAHAVVGDALEPSRTQHALLQSRIAISDPKFQLERPPRI